MAKSSIQAISVTNMFWWWWVTHWSGMMKC